ncbi:MAG TPA: hypothetical protein V6C81_02600 [Planktothrix sp.]|jgi:hypothetical protein
MKSSRTRLALTCLAVLLYPFISAAPAGFAAVEKSVTLKFPTERSSGKLYYVKLTNGGTSVTQPDSSSEIVNAQGNVSVPASQALSMVLTYFGVDHSAFLDSMAKSNINQIDAHDSENLNGLTIFHIGKLENLVSLHLNGTDIKDEDLKPLSACAKLYDLNFSNTLITGPGLAYLANCPIHAIKLQTVDLSKGNLQALPKLKQCTYLLIDQTTLPDSALKYIGKMPKLRQLEISKNNITDAGLKYLAGMPTLATINLCETKITAKAVETLKTMPALYLVHLRASQLTASEVAQWKKQMPKVAVVVDSHGPIRVDPGLFGPLH